MQANVKPGTRCECDHGSCTVRHARYYGRCKAEAVRMVSVSYYGSQRLGLGPGIATRVESVPMCEACAVYHEARQKERA